MAFKKNLKIEMWYIMDTVYLNGTAAEMAPICFVEKIEIGEDSPGSVTTSIQKELLETLSDELKDRYNSGLIMY